MDGIILIDKPGGMTSHDVVDEMRTKTGIRRIGHGGTLDPIATGLLIVAMGKACRALEFFENLNKEYEVVMRLGVKTDTLDREGKVLATQDASAVDQAGFETALKSFIGRIEQVVPDYSAVRVKGKKLYERAREGEPIEAPKRTVEIFDLQVLEFHNPTARVRIACTKGCYVRAIARDVGDKLGTLAICDEVRRTKVGPFTVEQAAHLDELSGSEDVKKRLRPVDQALGFLPEVRVGLEHQGRFLHGQVLDLRPAADMMRLYGPDGFLGIGQSSWGRYIKPRKVLR
jgi:tRNA pseudouridine55 synthase